MFWSTGFRGEIGGIESLAVPLVSDLVAAGHEVHVVSDSEAAQAEPPPSSADTQSKVHPPSALHLLPLVPVLRQRDLTKIAALRRRLREIEESLRPDLIHIFQFHAGVVFHLQQRRGNPIPTVLTIQGSSMLTETGPGNDSMARRLVREADWVVGCRPSLLEDLHSVVPQVRERSSCIPNAVVDTSAAQAAGDQQPSSSSASRSPESGPATIVACGRLVEQKGFDLAIRAFAQIAEQRPELRLQLVGDGLDEAKLKKLAQGLPGAERIEFLGRVTPEVSRAHLESASVVIMPSRDAEGIPLVGLEAALARRPIVGSRIPGITEVVEHEKTGLLVDEEDIDGFAKALSRCLDEPDFARQLGANARAFVASEYGWSGYVESYEALYQRLTKCATAGTTSA